VLWLATAGLVTVIALSGFAAASYRAADESLDHTLEVVAVTDDWLVTLYDAHTGARGFALSGDRASREPYERALRDETEIAARLRRLVADNPSQVRNVDKADRHAKEVMAGARRLVEQASAGRRHEAQAWVASGESMRRMDAFRSDWNGLRKEEERLLVERSADMRARAVLTVVAALVLTCASFGLLWLAWRLQHERTRALDQKAREARERLQALSDVAAALARARTVSDVSEVIVSEGMRVAGANTCTLYVMNDMGTALELVADRGVSSSVLDRMRRLARCDAGPAFEALDSGSASFVEDEAESRALLPELAGAKVEGRRARAFWSAPLVVEGKPVGLVGMGFFEPRPFSSEDRKFVDTLAQQCGQALVRASRLEREDEARRLFTTTLRSIGDAVIATDERGAVTFMNRVAERLTGWDENDARGRPLDEVFAIFSEETGKAVESPVTKVLREGAVVGLANHTILRSRRGLEIPIDDSGAPIRSEAGRMLGVVLVFRDVTREKREHARREFLAKAGEALVSSLDYERTLGTIARLAVPSLADWCAVEIVEPGAASSRQAAVAHVDPSKVRLAEEMGRRYPSDAQARSGVPEVIRSGRSELYSEIPSALIEAAARDSEHLRMLRDLRLESAMIVPLSAHGRTLGALTFVYAESGRRYARDDLEFAEDFARRASMAIENALALKAVEEGRSHEHRLRADAEVASRAKDEFLAMVSHELRTPLNAILGWTVMLRRRSPTTDNDRALAIIERNANTQAKLIEDVLDVSRIISGKLTLNLGATNVNEAITSALETVTPAADAKQIRIAADLSSELPAITADSDRVQQIVWNLLSNAVKFSPKNSTVSLHSYRNGSDVCIDVRDQGEGIRAEALPYIFDAFQQADLSTTRRHGGLGLGLAIVKQLVNAHGGTVRAESEGDGSGSAFFVTLPARSAVPAIGENPRPATSDLSTNALAPARLDGLRVLVVDDEADSLGLVREALRQWGAEVHTAGSVAEAMTKFSSVRPDVLVSDIGMPGEDGYALLRKVRSLSAAQGGRTPAVALTAYARAEDAQRAFAAGYQMHVAKPASPDQLLSVVANLGGRSLAPS
jgi:PAS domain S-box-containing protein